MAQRAHFLVRATAGRVPFPDARLSLDPYRREASRASPDLGGAVYAARNYRALESSSPAFVLEASREGLLARRISGRGRAAALGLVVLGLSVGFLLFLMALNAEGGTRGSAAVAFAPLLLLFACGGVAALPGRFLLAALPQEQGWHIRVVSASYGVLMHSLELRSDVGAVTVRVLGRRERLEAALRLAGQAPPARETFHEGFRA